MSTKVGSKGQVVIEKGFRDRLGIKPGWVALQQVVNDHLEIYFLPPPHNRSLMGVLAKSTKVRIAPGEEWEKAREAAWRAVAAEWLEQEGD